jgi:cytochrome c5
VSSTSCPWRGRSGSWCGGRSLAILCLVAAACAGHGHDHGVATGPPADAALVERRCTTCHSLEPVYASVGTEADWAEVVHRMVYHHKAKLLSHVTDDEAMAIVGWLAANRQVEPGSIRIGAAPTGWQP